MQNFFLVYLFSVVSQFFWFSHFKKESVSRHMFCIASSSWQNGSYAISEIQLSLQHVLFISCFINKLRSFCDIKADWNTTFSNRKNIFCVAKIGVIFANNIWAIFFYQSCRLKHVWLFQMLRNWYKIKMLVFNTNKTLRKCFITILYLKS